jgi:hypothetical protein
MVLFSERIFARELIPFWEKKGQTNPYLQKVCFFMYREISKFAYTNTLSSASPVKLRLRVGPRALSGKTKELGNKG